MQNYTPIDNFIAQLNPSAGLSASKETEPLAKTREPLKIHEITEQKEINENPENHIEIRKESIELTTELKEAGLETIEESALSAQKAISLPLSDEKVLIGLHKPITSSFRWLATFAMHMLKQAHLTLKVVHGKVVRRPY